MTESIRDPTTDRTHSLARTTPRAVIAWARRLRALVGRSEVDVYPRSDGRWGWCLTVGSRVRFSRRSYRTPEEAADAVLSELIQEGYARCAR
jgi:hypothetical protein